VKQLDGVSLQLTVEGKLAVSNTGAESNSAGTDPTAPTELNPTGPDGDAAGLVTEHFLLPAASFFETPALIDARLGLGDPLSVSMFTSLNGLSTVLVHVPRVPTGLFSVQVLLVGTGEIPRLFLPIPKQPSVPPLRIELLPSGELLDNELKVLAGPQKTVNLTRVPPQWLGGAPNASSAALSADSLVDLGSLQVRTRRFLGLQTQFMVGLIFSLVGVAGAYAYRRYRLVSERRDQDRNREAYELLARERSRKLEIEAWRRSVRHLLQLAIDSGDVYSEVLADALRKTKDQFQGDTGASGSGSVAPILVEIRHIRALCALESSREAMQLSEALATLEGVDAERGEPSTSRSARSATPRVARYFSYLITVCGLLLVPSRANATVPIPGSIGLADVDVTAEVDEKSLEPVSLKLSFWPMVTRMRRAERSDVLVSSNLGTGRFELKCTKGTTERHTTGERIVSMDRPVALPNDSIVVFLDRGTQVGKVTIDDLYLRSLRSDNGASAICDARGISKQDDWLWGRMLHWFPFDTAVVGYKLQFSRSALVRRVSLKGASERVIELTSRPDLLVSSSDGPLLMLAANQEDSANRPGTTGWRLGLGAGQPLEFSARISRPLVRRLLSISLPIIVALTCYVILLRLGKGSGALIDAIKVAVGTGAPLAVLWTFMHGKDGVPNILDGNGVTVFDLIVGLCFLLVGLATFGRLRASAT